ncbi:MAG: dihydropteroate synthase [Polyangia bacterium]
MGVVNVTPDSFSDGGRYLDPERAVGRGLEMIEQGAEIVDVGGESTRPGSRPVGDKEEMRRVIPVIEKLAATGEALISVDTTKPSVARAALEAGAGMINDVSTLRYGSELAETAAAGGVELVVMHSRKRPADMQEDIFYEDVVRDVSDELRKAARRAERAGVPPERIWIDPGIGFAKTDEHNVELLARIGDLTALGYRVIVGPSRKSFIGRLTGAPVGDRLGGTAAAVAAAVMGGVRAVRVHDVGMMKQAAAIAREIAIRRVAAHA